MRMISGLAAALLAASAAPAAAQIVTFDVPREVLYTYHNDDFTVRVRQPGGAWRDLYEYGVMVDMDDPQRASFVQFDAEGPVEVAVTRNNGDVRRVQVRPDASGVKPRLAGRTAYFTLTKPAKISVEFDGDRLHNLHLLANPIARDMPAKDAPGVMYFGPGIHTPPGSGRTFRVPSNTTLYMEGGAILRGGIEVRDAENVRIVGPGIIDKADKGVIVANSRNVTIDGPVVLNPNHYSVMCGQSVGVRILNFTAFSAGKWTDGIDAMACSDVLVDGAFLRTSDDAIAIYGRRWEFRGDVRGFTVQNSTLWADIAHPINIGLHGDSERPETIEGLVFRNIDILAHDEDDREYQGAIAISDGDDILIRDVLFDDIRVDDIEEGMLFNIRSVYNAKYSLAPGRGVRNITLRDIRLKSGELVNRSVIAGHSRERGISDVRLERVTVGGRPIRRADIDIGAFVTGVTITP